MDSLEEQPPKKKGRPTKYSALKKKQICKYIRMGMDREDSAVRIGIHISTFHEWINTISDFSEAVKVAEQQFESDQLQIIHNATKDKFDKLGRIKKQGDARMAAWLLERRMYRKYGQRWAGELTGKNGKPLIPADKTTKVDLSHLTDDELRGLGTNLRALIVNKEPIIPTVIIDVPHQLAEGNGNGNGGS